MYVGNHISNYVKFWLSKHGGTSDDKRVYYANISNHLHSESTEQFAENLNEMKKIWSQVFIENFELNLQETITSCIGRWLIEHRELYNPYSGITNNTVESMNAKF